MWGNSNVRKNRICATWERWKTAIAFSIHGGKKLGKNVGLLLGVGAREVVVEDGEGAFIRGGAGFHVGIKGAEAASLQEALLQLRKVAAKAT